MVKRSKKIKKSRARKKSEIHGKHKKRKAAFTTRQIKYKKFRLEGYSRYAAAKLAGYSESTAKAQHIEEGLPDFGHALEVAGLTDSYLAKQVVAGMEAMRTVSLGTEEYDDKGKRKWVEYEVPDWQARHRYLETALRDRDLAKKSDVPLIDQSEHTHLTIEVVSGEKEGKDPVDAGDQDQAHEETKLRLAFTD